MLDVAQPFVPRREIPPDERTAPIHPADLAAAPDAFVPAVVAATIENSVNIQPATLATSARLVAAIATTTGESIGLTPLLARSTCTLARSLTFARLPGLACAAGTRFSRLFTLAGLTAFPAGLATLLFRARETSRALTGLFLRLFATCTRLLTRFCAFTGRSRFTLGARLAGRTLAALAAGLRPGLTLFRITRLRLSARSLPLPRLLALRLGNLAGELIGNFVEFGLGHF
ncbi:MAG: hypothetical protein CK548_05605, partial [Opitutia bacterium]